MPNPPARVESKKDAVLRVFVESSDELATVVLFHRAVDSAHRFAALLEKMIRASRACASSEKRSTPCVRARAGASINLSRSCIFPHCSTSFVRGGEHDGSVQTAGDQIRVVAVFPQLHEHVVHSGVTDGNVAVAREFRQHLGDGFVHQRVVELFLLWNHLRVQKNLLLARKRKLDVAL